MTGTYNRGAIVRQMVEAALAQSRPPDEIVVSDDCSTDGTLEMLTELKAQHPQITILRQPKNSGGVRNWNHAVNASTADVIAWCSDDDRFAPGHLEASEAYLEAHPDVDLVHSGFINAWHDENGNVTEEETPLYSHEPYTVYGAEVVGYLIRQYSWPFHPSTLVFRRSLWQSVGEFDPAYQLADTDWFIRAVVRHKVAYLPRYGALNRRHMANWSIRTGSLRMHTEIDEAMRAALPTLAIGSLRRAVLGFRWSCFHQYRLARLFLARSRAGKVAIAGDIARSMRRSAGIFGRIIPEQLFVKVAAAVAIRIRRIQERFPEGVRRYDERAKWEPQ